MRGYYICSKYDICTYYISGRTDIVICTYYMSGRTDNVIYYSGGYISYILYMTYVHITYLAELIMSYIYITYQAELIMSYVHITCQAELILSYITCKVYMISGNERLRFSPPLMKYIILPDTKIFDRYIRHFFVIITIFRSQLHIFFSGFYK